MEDKKSLAFKSGENETVIKYFLQKFEGIKSNAYQLLRSCHIGSYAFLQLYSKVHYLANSFLSELFYLLLL